MEFELIHSLDYAEHNATRLEEISEIFGAQIDVFHGMSLFGRV